MSIRHRFYLLYCEINNEQPDFGDALPPEEFGDSKWTEKSFNTEDILAYYYVDSDRITRNSAFTRSILAAADTLLEVAGPNAGLFIKDPQISRIVSDAIDSFAIKAPNWDDASTEEIVRLFFGSAVVAFANNPGGIGKSELLKPVIESIKTLSPDQAGHLLTQEGITDFLGNVFKNFFERHVLHHQR